ncbi:hypothetical protein [Amycolatopsis sp. cmx-4-54]|uniref:hypothetical protein n=1 Tax=Amycolatopsis sp. cmx-4-54 TaxID=2790936 RepID=UPI00397BF0D0
MQTQNENWTNVQNSLGVSGFSLVNNQVPVMTPASPMARSAPAEHFAFIQGKPEFRRRT